MALKDTDILLDAQAAALKSSQVVKFGDGINKTFGAAALKVAKIRKERDDKWATDVADMEELLKVDAANAGWTPDLMKYFQQNKDEYLKLRKDFTKKGTGTQEYITSKARMASIKKDLEATKNFINANNEQTLDYKTEKQSGNLSSTTDFERNNARNNNKTSDIVFRKLDANGDVINAANKNLDAEVAVIERGVKFSYLDSHDKEVTETEWNNSSSVIEDATTGEVINANATKATYFDPAISEMESMNTMYDQTIKDIALGNYHEGAWESKVKMLTQNKLSKENALSFISDHLAPDGSSFADTDKHKALQAEWTTFLGSLSDTEKRKYNTHWAKNIDMIPTDEGSGWKYNTFSQTKDAVGDYLKNAYMPQFSEAMSAQIANNKANAYLRRISLGGDDAKLAEKQFTKWHTENKVNKMLTSPHATDVRFKEGEISVDKIKSVFDSMGIEVGGKSVKINVIDRNVLANAGVTAKSIAGITDSNDAFNTMAGLITDQGNMPDPIDPRILKKGQVLSFTIPSSADEFSRVDEGKLIKDPDDPTGKKMKFVGKDSKETTKESSGTTFTFEYTGDEDDLRTWLNSTIYKGVEGMYVPTEYDSKYWMTKPGNADDIVNPPEKDDINLTGT